MRHYAGMKTIKRVLSAGLLWGLILGAGLAWADASPEYFEWAFSNEMPQAGALSSPAWPPWVCGLEMTAGKQDQAGGAWVWQADEPAGSGACVLALDRTRLAADLALALTYGVEDTSHFIVQLLDDQQRVVALDLFSNVRAAGQQAWSDTFIIPLARYPGATRIAIRRLAGPLQLYGFVLYPVQSEVSATLDEQRALAQWLGDTLSPGHALLQAIQNTAPAQAGTLTIQKETIRPLEFLEKRNPVGYQTLGTLQYPRYHAATGTLAGKFELYFSGTTHPFLQNVMRHLRVYHPGADWQLPNWSRTSPHVLNCLLDGETRLGLCSRPMTSAQREEFTRRFGHPVREARIALDALQILAHPGNPLAEITLPQLDAIYGTELRAGAQQLLRTWDQLGLADWGGQQAILAYGGWPHYGTSRFFQDAVLMGGPFRADLKTVGDISYDPETVIAREPYAISFCTFMPRGNEVKVLAVARQSGEPAYPPLPAHIYGEEYPLVRYFYVYANAGEIGQLPPETREFLNYLLSYEGQADVAGAGCLPLDARMVARARKLLGL